MSVKFPFTLASVLDVGPHTERWQYCAVHSGVAYAHCHRSAYSALSPWQKVAKFALALSKRAKLSCAWGVHEDASAHIKGALPGARVCGSAVVG